MCGIFGIINKKPRKLDKTAFCVLGSHNDSRGGDSCGIFIDGKVEYGIDKKADFRDFFKESEVLKGTNECTIALGHCRKASTGFKVNLEGAQPVVIRTKNGKVQFVLIHNGTIHNYKELAEKYIPKVDIKDLTDSQVMARIFYYRGYDVLKEYIGAGAFVAVDYRFSTPKVLMFKGASKKWKSSKENEEERPLFVSSGNGETVFSSLQQYLLPLRPENEIFTVSPNVLVSVEGDSLEVVAEYDRSAVFQSKPEAVTVYSGSGTFYGNSSYYGKTAGTTGKSTESRTSYTGTYKESSYDLVPFLMEDAGTNTYKIRQKLAHDKIYVCSNGRVLKVMPADKKSPYEGEVYEIYFYQGIPLRDGKRSFTLLECMRKKLKMDSEEFVKEYENLVRYYSTDRLFKRNGVMVKAVDYFEAVPFSGDFQMITSYKRFSYKDGVESVSVYVKDRTEPLKNLDKEVEKINVNQLSKKCLLQTRSQSKK